MERASARWKSKLHTADRPHTLQATPVAVPTDVLLLFLLYTTYAASKCTLKGLVFNTKFSLPFNDG